MAYGGIMSLLSRCSSVVICLLLMSRIDSKEVQPMSSSRFMDVRLVDGDGRCSGHLEMKHQGEWRTFNFRHTFASDEVRYAHVACRQIGCGSVVSFKNQFNNTIQTPAWKAYFSCHGSEETFEQCKEAASSKEVEDIDSSGLSLEVVCSEVIRVVSSYSTCSGKVMAMSNVNWLPVCEFDSAIGIKEDILMDTEKMLCKELGCGPPQRFSWQMQTEETRVLSKMFMCLGNESRLQECASSTHSDCKRVLQISCSNPMTLRLVGGENRCQGVIEGKNEAEWRPVTDIWGHSKEEQMLNLCQQLECGPLISSSTKYLREKQPVWEMLRKCDSKIFCKSWRDSTSRYMMDVTCSEAVRLVKGRDRCTGLLEVKSDRSWHSICESHFTSQNALVVCRELSCGFPHVYSGISPAESLKNTLYFDCNGKEEHLVDCSSSFLAAKATNNQCKSTYLICKKLPGKPHITIFSIQGEEKSQSMDVYEGHQFVISCGLSSPYKIHSFHLNSYFKQSEWNQSAVENVAHFIFPAAEHSHQGNYYCSYSFDFTPEIFSEQAGFYLKVRDALYVRLVDERSRCLGRLELEHRQEWRPVRQHQSWSLKEAAVVCRQLGCGSAVRTKKTGNPDVHLPVWQFYSDCDGTESALLDCGTVKEWVSTSTIEVLCSDIMVPPNITVYTQNTYKEEKEMVYEGHSFFINCSVEARFPGGHFSLVITGVNHTQSLYQTAVNHSAIFEISSAGKTHTGNYSCIYSNTVSEQYFSFESQSLAITVENYESEDVRLDSGVLQEDGDPTICAGKLLISKRSEMKMVTAQSPVWDLSHASIVCRQLGCGEAVSTSKIQLQKVTSMWRFYSDCDGSEAALLECGDISEWYSSTAVQVVCAGKT